uniref:Uncharacterized protein n=1 Tax=Cyprinus carpio TaxID=7962 RepID=A0A8C1YL40_CYPCA
MMKGACVWSLVAVCVLCVCVAYKPVIIIHGLFDTSADFINLHRFINLVKHSSDYIVMCFLSLLCVTKSIKYLQDMPKHMWFFNYQKNKNTVVLIFNY